MDIKACCYRCNKERVAKDITFADWHKFSGGLLVQNVWPERSEDEREILIGFVDEFYLCPVCWDETAEEPVE